MSTKPLGYGLIGAGNFGRFCAKAYQELDSVRPIAVADASPDIARQAADDLGLEACESVDQLLARDDIDIVHVATPPSTHGALVTDALEAGKHVLCEKPLAVDPEVGQRLVDLARERDRVLSVNLIMRYDPLNEAVKQIVDAGLLGRPLHGIFENYAMAEQLPDDHWFWDRAKSGGIFVEHGVHFFDLFAWWLAGDKSDDAGWGTLCSADQSARPDKPHIVDQQAATVRYGHEATAPRVHFYHGFTQPTGLDRQELRLLCERGDIRLHEWVPTSIDIDCLATAGVARQIASHLPDADIVRLEKIQGDNAKHDVRGQQFEVDGRYRITGTAGMDKDALYHHVVRALMDDQAQAIADPSHRRRITEANGIGTLRLAAAAQTLADAGCSTNV
jgi:predicted dehydrogenase